MVRWKREHGCHTFQSGLVPGVVLSRREIGVVVILIVNKVSVLIVAERVGLDNISLVTCMVDSLRIASVVHLSKQTSFKSRSLTLLYDRPPVVSSLPSRTWEAFRLSLLPRLVGC